jgi:signal transduction histidine kinase
LARETAEMIAYNISRAAQLIQSFKQVAIDQTGERQRSFDLAVFLEQLIRSLRPDIRKAGLTLELICAEGITMDSFPGALGQVITNLVHNAMIHAYDSGSGGAITVTGELLPDSRVGLLVADSGRGMPPEVLAKIYDPFFTTRRAAGGSGLGMHIVFNLVSERLKGEIRCDSAVGKGTRFSLAIPRTVPAA